MISKNNFLLYQKKEKKFSPGQKFYQLLCDGLRKNECNLHLYSLTNLGKYILASSNSDSINYYCYSKKTERTQMAKKIAHDISLAINPKTDVIIADTDSYWPLKAALYCRKKTNCKIIGLTTDFPQHVLYYAKKKMSILNRILKTINAYSKLPYIKKADAYILLAEGMREIIGYKKPYMICEGFCETDNTETKKHTKYGKKIISYLGSLNEQSGIKNLIECVKTIDRTDFELHIYGDGTWKEYVENAQKDIRIKYHGVVDQNEVKEIERKSDFLINPRPSNEKFNRYSFPSKTIEYMASGTPLISTKLECIGDDYKPYILWLRDNNIDVMRDDLNKIIDMHYNDCIDFGLQAKDFVYKKKSKEVQGKQILEFAKQILKDNM